MSGKTGADAPSWRQGKASGTAAAAPAPTAVPLGVPQVAAAAVEEPASMLVGSPTSGGSGWKEPGRKKDSDNWRAHPSPAVVLASHETANLVVGSPPKSHLRAPRLADAGPATPLQPLSIGVPSGSTATAARPLAHPNVSPRLGGENWAITPSSSLPSLPGTPRRLPRPQMGSYGADEHTAAPASGLTMGSPAFRSLGNASPRQQPLPPSQLQGSVAAGSSSRDLVAARALLNRRADEAGGTAVRAGPAASPAAAPVSAVPAARLGGVTGSPKRSPLSLAPTSSAMLPPTATGPTRVGRGTPNLSPGPSPRLAHRTATPVETSATMSILAPSAVVAGSQNPAQSLLRRDSMASIASSSAQAAGTHSLSHSRKASQNFSSASLASPTYSNVNACSSNYRAYRPPHLRNRDSGHNLRPAVQHYDRVRTPSLRGYNRSPDPSSAAASSYAGSRPPSTTPFSPASELSDALGRAAGRRRLSSLGSYSSVVPEDLQGSATFDEIEERQSEGHTEANSQSDTPMTSDTARIDNQTLMDKLVRTWASRRSTQASASSHGGDTAAESEAGDDVDLSIEEMLAASASQLSLTDSFCLSRHASHITDNARPVDVFEVGDRLGPGMMHDGLRINIAQTSDGFVEQVGDITGSQLEVVRKLGEGSYAVVYLVREVDPDDARLTDEAAFGAPEGLPVNAKPRTTDTGDDIYSRTLRASDMADRTMSTDGVDTPSAPREFALKCLCKRDLSDEMLEVQRLESTIHQSIPRHPHIVTLYRTYETADWLFLILEYCPGQDLYYWLEQAQDSDNPSVRVGGAPTDSADASLTLGAGDASGDTTVLDATPPSPSLLASTAGAALLSRKRLRLVSRMFSQMCDAVQYCHDRGISHRDIKPENFIVEDRRDQFEVEDVERPISRAHSRPSTASTRRSSSLSVFGDGMRDIEARIIVKLTDFGLAVAQEQCVDFDCGSKPYMAYECHNNVSQWYDPRQADIWSLGVVLLNLLFHRSPFSEPSVQGCESFAAYSYDPVRFLTQAFDGLTEQAAEYLAQNVLCDVTNPKSDGSPRRRVSAKEFGAWAAKLPQLLSLDGKASRGADADVTSPLHHSRSPSSSGLSSFLGSPVAQGSAGPPPLTIHEEMGEGAAYPSLFPEYASRGDNSPHRPSAIRTVSSNSLSPHIEGTPDILPTPTFSPPPQIIQLPPIDTQAAAATASSSQLAPPVAASAPQPKAPAPATVAAVDWFQQQVTSATKENVTVCAVDWFSQQCAEATSAPSPAPALPAVESVEPTSAPVTVKDAEPVEELATADDRKADEANADGEGDFDDHDGSDAMSSVAASMNPKRRKRGARKGRNDKKQDLKRSHSAENLASLSSESSFPHMRRGSGRDSSFPHPRDAVLADLAAASQTLAREMSRRALKTNGSSTPAAPSSDSSTVASPHVLVDPKSRRPSATPSAASGRTESTGITDSPLTYAANASRDSVGSRASTQFTNYSWAPRPPSIASTTNSARNAAGDVASSTSSPKDTSIRRDHRVIREPRGPALEDSGRGHRSWRERNVSTASIDSSSTFSSVFSDTASSIYSTASAPAAAGRRSTTSLASSTGVSGGSSGRSRFSKAGLLNMGLDTISEKKRGPVKGEELDASYLAAIFGGAPAPKPVKPRQKDEDAHLPERGQRPRQQSASSEHSSSSQRTTQGGVNSPDSANDARKGSGSLGAGQPSELSLSGSARPSSSGGSSIAPSFRSSEGTAVPPAPASAPAPTKSSAGRTLSKFFRRPESRS